MFKTTIASLLLLWLLASCYADVLGPSATPTSGGTFVGFDGRSMCKFCQIDCLSVPIFQASTCQPRYYLYGCDIRHPCLDISSANLYQFYAAIGMCMKFNGCKLQGALQKDVEFPSQDGKQLVVPAKQMLDTFLYREAILQWRQTVKTMSPSFFNGLSKSMNSALAAVGYFADVPMSMACKFNDRFKRDLGSEADRVCTYMEENAKRRSSVVGELGKLANATSYLASIASGEAKKYDTISDEERRRLFREYLLQTVTPTLPPAVYLYFKFSQDAKVSSELALLTQTTDSVFPSWLKDDIQISSFSQQDATGLAIQIKRGNVRLDKLFDWVNDFSTNNYQQYYSIYITLLKKATILSDVMVSAKTWMDCGALKALIDQEAKHRAIIEKQCGWLDFKCHVDKAMSAGVLSDTMMKKVFAFYSVSITVEQCKAVNDKIALENSLQQIEDKMNNEYRKLIAEFATEAGMNAPTDALGMQAKDLFFRFPNYDSGMDCFLQQPQEYYVTACEKYEQQCVQKSTTEKECLESKQEQYTEPTTVCLASMKFFGVSLCYSYGIQMVSKTRTVCVRDQFKCIKMGPVCVQRPAKVCKYTK